MVACASFALIGFPLDDVSHRLFGQDVTLWGPTHLMMLGGAALTLVADPRAARRGAARAARARDGRRRRRRAVEPAPRACAARRMVGACGGMLVGLSIFQGEFDYGVPQFRLLVPPAADRRSRPRSRSCCARTLIGRGGALAAVAFFLVLRGALALLVGPVLGETVPHFPLYVAEAPARRGARAARCGRGASASARSRAC